jgi:hypothetical protein
MKGAICGLFASTLLLTIAPSQEAWAQKRVVVEKFSGPGTLRLRSMVLAVLAQKGADVVAIEKVTATEADLGLLQVSDNYGAVAKELKVNAFFGGSITGKGRKLTARVRGTGPNGKMLGQAQWSGRNLAKLFAAVGATLSKKMTVMLNAAPAKVDSGGGEPVASKAKDAPAVAAAAVDPDEAPSKSKRVASADDEEPPRKSSGSRKSADDEEAIAASGDEGDEAPSTGRTKMHLSLGAHVYRRDFNYNDNIRGGQQAYKLPAVPAPTLSFEYFFLPNFGATLGGEYSVALVSQDGAGNKYKTNSLAYYLGGLARTWIGSGTELQGHATYAVNSFKVTPEVDDPNPPQVAGVNYQQIRVGGSGRLPLNEKMAIIGGGSYLHLLSMGAIRSDYFPNATGRGGEGFAGIALSLPWMKGLEGRVTADIRRYVFSMNPEVMDEKVAGGAVDQYIGLNLGVSYRN